MPPPAALRHDLSRSLTRRAEAEKLGILSASSIGTVALGKSLDFLCCMMELILCELILRIKYDNSCKMLDLWWVFFTWGFYKYVLIRFLPHGIVLSWKYSLHYCNLVKDL